MSKSIYRLYTNGNNLKKQTVKTDNLFQIYLLINRCSFDAHSMLIQFELFAFFISY